MCPCKDRIGTVSSTGMELNWTPCLSHSPRQYLLYPGFHLAAAVSLSVHPSHSKPSLLIWTQPTNRSVVSASQLQSPPIYYSLEHSRADGPPEGHVVARLTRRCQTLMHYHNRTEERQPRPHVAHNNAQLIHYGCIQAGARWSHRCTLI